MARTVIDPYTRLSDVLEQAIRSEFDDLQFLEIRHDRIHESLGTDGVTYVGISPDGQSSTYLDLQTDVLIQFYGPYLADVDPYQQVDPRVVTAQAERLRQALSDVRTVGTSDIWFFDVVTTRYPSDATGNKSRFEMVVRGRGNDSGLLRETTG